MNFKYSLNSDGWSVKMLKLYATFVTVMLLSQNAMSENPIEQAIRTVDAEYLIRLTPLQLQAAFV